MKCVCGYSKIDSWEFDELTKEEREKEKQKEDFRLISGTFQTELYHPRGSYNGAANITLCVCPKCNTVKFGGIN